MSLVPGDGGLKPQGDVDASALAEAIRTGAAKPTEGCTCQPGTDHICPLHGRRGSAKDHAALMREMIVHISGITPHEAVRTAVDHALEAFDRYCEQEGLS